MARILSDIGWQTSIVEGGYKAYRRHIVRLPRSAAEPPPDCVMGEPDAKPILLAAQKRCTNIDLEGIACHRGSLPVKEPYKPQPSNAVSNRVLPTL